MLRPLGLAPNHQASRQVLDLNGRVTLVDVLPASPAAAARNDLQIGISERHLSLCGLWENRYGHRASLHSAPLLSWRNALPAMTASLILEGLLGILAREPEHHETRTLVYEFGVKETSELLA